MKSLVVLDASALLAVLFAEKGADRVLPHLPGALLSTVNLAEVHSKAVDYGMPLDEAIPNVGSLPIVIAAFNPDQALIAASLRPTTRSLGLSLGDRACLALAIDRRAHVITADSAWKSVDAGVKITVIR